MKAKLAAVIAFAGKMIVHRYWDRGAGMQSAEVESRKCDSKERDESNCKLRMFPKSTSDDCHVLKIQVKAKMGRSVMV